MGVNRIESGKRNVGQPLFEVTDALYDALEAGEARVISEAIEDYVEEVMMEVLPEMISDNLSDDELARVDPRVIQAAGAALLRDLFLRVPRIGLPAEWVGALFAALSRKLWIDVQPRAVSPAQDLAAGKAWAAPIASALGVPADQLYFLHETVVTDIGQRIV